MPPSSTNELMTGLLARVRATYGVGPSKNARPCSYKDNQAPLLPKFNTYGRYPSSCH
jgi:hypothetical protein